MSSARPPTDRTEHAEQIEDYVAALAGRLHGPADVKGRMLDEIRDGLEDTVAARVRRGTPPQRALAEAVREFGSAEELVPECQRELTFAQTRRTARTVVLAVPFLLACCYLVSIGAGDLGPLRLVAYVLSGTAIVAATVSVSALTFTGSCAPRLPVPSWLPRVVAWSGTAAGVSMALSTVALAVAAPMVATWPALVLAGVLSIAGHGIVAGSAGLCRRCARLSSAPGGA